MPKSADNEIHKSSTQNLHWRVSWGLGVHVASSPLRMPSTKGISTLLPVLGGGKGTKSDFLNVFTMYFEAQGSLMLCRISQLEGRLRDCWPIYAEDLAGKKGCLENRSEALFAAAYESLEVSKSQYLDDDYIWRNGGFYEFFPQNTIYWTLNIGLCSTLLWKPPCQPHHRHVYSEVNPNSISRAYFQIKCA